MWVSYYHSLYDALPGWSLTYAVPFIFQLVPYWIASALFLLMDLTQAPTRLYRSSKVQPQAEPVTPALAWKVATNVFLNQMLVMPLVSVFWYLLSFGRFSIRVTRDVPSWGVFLYEVAMCVVLLDVFFYYNHRAFHSRWLWKYHAVHHELRAPFGLSADYLHPIEFFCMNSCAMLAAMVLNAHLYSTAIFFALGNTGGVINHSGYHFPLVPAWMRDPEHHDFHHSHPNNNFSFFHVLDYLHQTNKGWLEHIGKATSGSKAVDASHKHTT